MNKNNTTCMQKKCHPCQYWECSVFHKVEQEKVAAWENYYITLNEPTGNRKADRFAL